MGAEIRHGKILNGRHMLVCSVTFLSASSSLAFNCLCPASLSKSMILSPPLTPSASPGVFPFTISFWCAGSTRRSAAIRPLRSWYVAPSGNVIWHLVLPCTTVTSGISIRAGPCLSILLRPESFFRGSLTRNLGNGWGVHRGHKHMAMEGKKRGREEPTRDGDGRGSTGSSKKGRGRESGTIVFECTICGLHGHPVCENTLGRASIGLFLIISVWSDTQVLRTHRHEIWGVLSNPEFMYEPIHPGW